MKHLILILSVFLLIACEEQPGGVENKQPNRAIEAQFPTEQDLANYSVYLQQKARYEQLHAQFSATQIVQIFQQMQIVYIPTYSANDMCQFLWHSPRVQNYSYGAGQFYNNCMWATAYIESLTPEQKQYLEIYFNGGI